MSVFPACAGVIQDAKPSFSQPNSIPRMRGGDPYTLYADMLTQPYSPHAQGDNPPPIMAVIHLVISISAFTPSPATISISLSRLALREIKANHDCFSASAMI